MTFFMRPLRLIAVACLMVFVSAGVAWSQDDEDETPDRLVTLDAATVARLGIVTAAVETSEYQGETSGFGLVMPYDTLAQSYSDLATAESASQASAAALARSRALFAADVSVSRQTVEAAERQSVADTAQLSLVQRRAEAAWGQGAPWHNAADLSKLLMRLSSGELALVRVTFSSSAVGAAIPSSFRIQRVETGAEANSWTAKTIWRAPADPTVPGLSFFALVERARGLLPGERLLVFVPGEHAQQGVVIPSTAMIIAEGTSWYYYTETQPLIIPMAPQTNFVRASLDMSRPTPEGYFVPGGEPGQKVVVEGAGLLLARETGVEDDED